VATSIEDIKKILSILQDKIPNVKYPFPIGLLDKKTNETTEYKTIDEFVSECDVEMISLRNINHVVVFVDKLISYEESYDSLSREELTTLTIVLRQLTQRMYMEYVQKKTKKHDVSLV